MDRSTVKYPRAGNTIARAVAKTPIRDQKTEATRQRIAETALDLFVTHGYADTTIDQIADEAGVARRTVFRHFPTKEAILIDHLVVRRDVALQRLRDRPADESALVSLHAVLRELAKQGYDRGALAQIQSVLASNPGVAEQLTITMRAFEKNLISTLEVRPGQTLTHAELRAITLMALSWLDAAVRTYLLDNQRSLVKCFDRVVALCVRSCATDLSAQELGGVQRAGSAVETARPAAGHSRSARRIAGTASGSSGRL